MPTVGIPFINNVLTKIIPLLPEIEFIKYHPNSKLSGIFLDPLGYHLLLAFTARNKDGYPELVYLHRKSSKLKPVSKSKNYEVTEVGWNYENTSENSTGPILLGTLQGHILETELEADSDRMFTANQQYWRQVMQCNKWYFSLCAKLYISMLTLMFPHTHKSRLV